MTKKDEKEETPKGKPFTDKADDAAVAEGFLFGLELSYFEKFNRKDLLSKGYSEADVDRIERVLAKVDKSLPAKSVPPNKNKMLKPDEEAAAEG